VKHNKFGEAMRSECVTGDSSCLLQHKGLQLTMPTGEKLITELHNMMHIRYIHTHTHIYTNIHTNIYTNIHTNIYTYTHTHIYIHTYTHIH
jgi:hypothetical protein